MRKAIHGSVLCLAWLLCALVVLASVDTVPDPPAVDPCRVEAKAQCFNNPSSAVQLRGSDCCVPARCTVLRWIAVGKIIEAKRPENRIALVERAADPSPPAFA